MIAFKIKNQLGCPETVQISEQIANLKVEHSICNSINEVSSKWDNVCNNQPVFLQKAYLSALEKVNAAENDFKYVQFERNGEAVAIAYFQLITIKENIGSEARDKWLTKCWKEVANSYKLNLLICGNAFITGDFGFHYNEHLISGDDAFLALNEAVETIKKSNPKINVVLVKDFLDSKAENAQKLLNFDFINAKFQPSMQIAIKENWQTIDDYKADISSKYKKRFRSVLKKGDGVEGVIMSPELISKHKQLIVAYYKEIIGRSEFVLGDVSEDYFYECVNNLPDNFILKGYFVDDHLAGFITYILNNDDMESHFIGYDTKYNGSHKIYNYILYDLLETAINNKVKTLVYGRTAMEIKSTIGAVGVDLSAFVWVKNPVLRLGTKRAISKFRHEEWQPRNPFK